MGNDKIKVEVMPTISVLMAAYNCEKYIVDSVESILNQTISDFELIITDDCSTDNTLAILKEYAKKDTRIRLQINSENLGLTKSLNRMIDISKGKFLARMDADDISLAQRFEKQLEFMKTHPGIGVCGALTEHFGESITHDNRTRGCFDHEEIKTTLMFSNPLSHSTVFFRKDFIDQYDIRYNERFRVIQDYELWQRVVHLTKMAKIPEVLLLSRVTGNSITIKTMKKKGYRGKLLKQIYKNIIETLGFSPTIEELDIHNLIVSNNIINDNAEYLKKGEDWLNKLYQWNQTSRVYDDNVFFDLLCGYWFFLCTRSTSLGLFTAMLFFRSDFYIFRKFSVKNHITLLIKCIIRYNDKTLLNENRFYDGCN